MDQAKKDFLSQTLKELEEYKKKASVNDVANAWEAAKEQYASQVKELEEAGYTLMNMMVDYSKAEELMRMELPNTVYHMLIGSTLNPEECDLHEVCTHVKGE